MKKLEESGLSREEIINAFEAVLRGRRLDERLWQLTRMGKTSFHISGQGAETAQVAMALAFDHEKDYFLPYYRDLAACLVWGMTCEDILLGTFAREADPSSHGRQMPDHYGSKEHNIVSQSSPVSTQYPIANGIAYSAILRNEKYVAVVTTGDGSFNQGECAEAMNFAGVHHLPVVFVVQNNGYAISVPQRESYAAKLADRAIGYGFEGIRINGSDFAESYLAFKHAADKARKGEGPVLIEAMVERITSHSSDDDQTVYRSAEEIAEMKAHDPVKIFHQQVIDEGYLTEEEVKEMDARLKKEINQATDAAEAEPAPTLDSISDEVYSTAKN